LGLGRDAGNVVADVAHLVERKRVLIMADRQNAISVWRVLPRHNRNHASERFCAAGINVLDAGVWIGRVQDLADQHARHKQIVRVSARASGFLRRVYHGDGLSDDGKITHGMLRVQSAPAGATAAVPFCSASIAALIAWYIWL